MFAHGKRSGTRRTTKVEECSEDKMKFDTGMCSGKVNFTD